jgi:NhaP-type Na+/H+ or K+/H+ antiporter
LVFAGGSILEIQQLKEPPEMTIALDIIFAVIVFTGVVGLLAASVIASRSTAPRKARPATAKGRARRRAYAVESANAF